MIEEIDGVKIIATPKQYEKYKKSLEEQLEEKDKEIEKLNYVIEHLKAILKSKGYETYIPILEKDDKEC